MTLFPLRLIPDLTNIRFMATKNFNIAFSIILVLISLAGVFTKGINFSVDFTGGAMMEVSLSHVPDLQTIYNKLHENQIKDVVIQNFSETNLMIRLGNKGESNQVLTEKVELLKSILAQQYQDVNFRKIDFVGPQVGGELIHNGIVATILSLIAITLYTVLRFDLSYGFGMMIALAHDVIVTVGMMSITGLEFNHTSIAAILTVLGYSVNDSVVIYDRIRENRQKYRSKTVYELIDLSINETLSRTILTVFVTLLSVLSLMIFGGHSLWSFSAVVFFGIIIGTYSSIYISAPALVHTGFKDGSLKI